MKNIFIILISLFISINVFSGTKKVEDSKFNEGLTFYAKKEFNQALNNFLELKKIGYDNFEINYNIGSCYFQLEKYGFARFYFEQALFYKPLDKDLYNNLVLVYSKVLKEPAVGIQEIMNKRVIYFIPFMFIVILFSVFFILTLILLFLIFKFKIFKKIYIIFLIISFIFTIIFTILFFIQYIDYNKKIFVVKENITNVYLLPNNNETILTTITEGIKGKILEKSENFVKVNLSDGTAGWVNINDIVGNF